MQHEGRDAFASSMGSQSLEVSKIRGGNEKKIKILVIYNNYFKQSEKLQKIWLSIINIYYRNPKFWRSCYWCYKASGES